MTNDDILLLEKHGWITECESPFEIVHEDDQQSRATGLAAYDILEALRPQQTFELDTIYIIVDVSYDWYRFQSNLGVATCEKAAIKLARGLRSGNNEPVVMYKELSEELDRSETKHIWIQKLQLEPQKKNNTSLASTTPSSKKQDLKQKQLENLNQLLTTNIEFLTELRYRIAKLEVDGQWPN